MMNIFCCFLFSAAQFKMIQDRMNATENHLGQICDTMSSYTRKTAHVRDKGAY